MSTNLVALSNSLAQKLGLPATGDLLDTLKSTVFSAKMTDGQLAALLIIAGQFGLNPWTREVYAVPDRNNGIIPVVGVDGWSRIINSHPQFDGLELDQDNEKCTCRIYRKDRSHPTVVTEFMDECRRETGPWKSHARRMLRHKALIQCARLAFGYAGIFDLDEAERIQAAEIGANDSRVNPETGEILDPNRQELEDRITAQARSMNKDQFREFCRNRMTTAERQTLGAEFLKQASELTVIEAELQEVPVEQSEAS